ncbi:DoxX family protein [Nocardia sp. BMG51109]|uniref:DoxX family protein n=1 Tax=Nocardia sp. BMG51109 TaxID=1056816 RepID=UPI000464B3C7|nr:DoxX family protein [Nocardia sp. BMG51109]
MTAPTTDSTALDRRPGGDVTGVDIGLLLFRLFFGGLLFAHGAQKLFGWFNGPGMDATNASFDQMGYNPGKFFGTLAGLSELVGGGLLFLGLLTPLAGAIVLGTMLNAINATWHSGLFGGMQGPGYEMALLFGVVGAAIAFTGPGRISLDAGRPWQRQGLVWGAAAVVLAVVAGVVTLILKWSL